VSFPKPLSADLRRRGVCRLVDVRVEIRGPFDRFARRFSSQGKKIGQHRVSSGSPMRHFVCKQCTNPSSFSESGDSCSSPANLPEVDLRNFPHDVSGLSRSNHVHHQKWCFQFTEGAERMAKKVTYWITTVDSSRRNHGGPHLLVDSPGRRGFRTHQLSAAVAHPAWHR